MAKTRTFKHAVKTAAAPKKGGRIVKKQTIKNAAAAKRRASKAPLGKYISRSGIQNLSHRAGALRMSSKAYPVVSDAIVHRAGQIAQIAKIVAELAGRKTVQSKHVHFALKMLGSPALGGDVIVKRRRTQA
jgi:histone H3/H4